MSSSNQIPFGLKEGRMVGVGEVESGLACDCLCANCNGALVARKGQVNVHHFAHASDSSDCHNAAETALHRMAKQIFVEHKRFKAPEYRVTEKYLLESGQELRTRGQVTHAKTYTFDLVEEEVWLELVRADLVAVDDMGQFAIEIKVTHACGKSKVSHLQKLSIRAVEADLSEVPRSITKDELTEKLLNTPTLYKWMAHPQEKEIRDNLWRALHAEAIFIREQEEAERAEKEQERRRIRSLSVANHQRIIEEGSAAQQENEHVGADGRWFLCEGCRNIWNIPEHLCREIGATVTCPKCQFEAGTSRTFKDNSRPWWLDVDPSTGEVKG